MFKVTEKIIKVKRFTAVLPKGPDRDWEKKKVLNSERSAMKWLAWQLWIERRQRIHQEWLGFSHWSDKGPTLLKDLPTTEKAIAFNQVAAIGRNDLGLDYDIYSPKIHCSECGFKFHYIEVDVTYHNDDNSPEGQWVEYDPHKKCCDDMEIYLI